MSVSTYMDVIAVHSLVEKLQGIHGCHLKEGKAIQRNLLPTCRLWQKFCHREQNDSAAWLLESKRMILLLTILGWTRSTEVWTRLGKRPLPYQTLL